MKKIISVLAMVLLVIGAAQAQNVTKRMVIQFKDGQVVKYNTENIEDVTFEIIDLSNLPDVPTTIEEAKAILADSYWKIDAPLDEYSAEIFEGYYIVITDNLEASLCYKFKDSVTDEDYALFAGKYIAESFVEVTFPSDDPTTFYLGEWTVGTNLQLYSFDYNNDDITYHCVRVEPFEYVMLGDDYLFKGKPGLR